MTHNGPPRKQGSFRLSMKLESSTRSLGFQEYFLDMSIATTSPHPLFPHRECRFPLSFRFIRTNATDCCSWRRITARPDVPLILRGPTLYQRCKTSMMPGAASAIGTWEYICSALIRPNFSAAHCHAWHRWSRRWHLLTTLIRETKRRPGGDAVRVPGSPM